MSSSSTTTEPSRAGGTAETEARADQEATTTEREAPPEQAPPEPALPLDQIFDVLKNKRRRVVLQYLEDEETPVSMSDLSEAVAAEENDKPVAQLSSDERKRVYVGLYQCHLPKMDSMDIVSFNKPRGLIELAENHDLVKPYLQDEDIEPVRQDRWARRYLLLSGLGLLALLIAVTTGGESVLRATFAGLVVAFAGCSVWYYRTVRASIEDGAAAETD
jgi:hypothetical protein